MHENIDAKVEPGAVWKDPVKYAEHLFKYNILFKTIYSLQI